MDDLLWNLVEARLSESKESRVHEKMVKDYETEQSELLDLMSEPLEEADGGRPVFILLEITYIYTFNLGILLI